MKTNKIALITGGSSGIGYELAKCFARDGYDLVLVARDQQGLESVADTLKRDYKIDVWVLAQDLSLPGAVDAVVKFVDDHRLVVDVLVNNAGFGLRGEFMKTDWKKERDMIEVNVTALTELSKLFVRRMVARGSGRILNVASTAAFQPGPLMAVYYATKSYVVSFSYALAYELTGTGVTVTTLCPGATATSFGATAGMGKTRLFRGSVMSAERVALAGYRGLMRGKRLVVPGILHYITVLLAGVVPMAVSAAIAARVHGVDER